MILTPLTPGHVPDAVAAFARHLDDDPVARSVLDRVHGSVARLSAGFDTAEDRLSAGFDTAEDRRAAGFDTAEDRRAACALVAAFEIPFVHEEPAQAFSWDGQVLRACTEASVLIHEVAHYLVAVPERRFLLDFGLGAGPESGRAAEADAARAADDETREIEEALSSLLGILWEVELGQPGLCAFLEQNWLEGYERPSAAGHFLRCLRLLAERGLITADGRPTGPEVLLPGLRRDVQNHCPRVAQDSTAR